MTELAELSKELYKQYSSFIHIQIKLKLLIENTWDYEFEGLQAFSVDVVGNQLSLSFIYDGEPDLEALDQHMKEFAEIHQLDIVGSFNDPTASFKIALYDLSYGGEDV